MNQNQPNQNKTGVEYAAETLLKMGLTPSQVAYVFRGVMDSVMHGLSVPSARQVDDAFAGKVDAMKSEFSMADDDGYCYLRGIKVTKRVNVAMELGASPSVERFLSLTSEEYDIYALKRLTFTNCGEGRLHLHAPGGGGVSAYDRLAATFHHMNTGVSPSYRAFSRGGKYVAPLQTSDVIGATPRSMDGDCKFAGCMETVCGNGDKVLVITNPDGVYAFDESPMSVAVVASDGSKSYIRALFPHVKVLTVGELSIRECFDVIVVASDPIASFDDMKRIVGQVALFSKYCVGFCAFDTSDTTQELLEFLKTFPVADMPEDCACGLLVRRTPLTLVSGTQFSTIMQLHGQLQRDDQGFWTDLAGVTVTNRTPADVLVACVDMSIHGSDTHTFSPIGRSVQVLTEEDFVEGLEQKAWPVVCVHNTDIEVIKSAFGSHGSVRDVTDAQESAFSTVCVVDTGMDDYGTKDLAFKVGLAITRHSFVLKYFCMRTNPKSLLSIVMDGILLRRDSDIESVMLPTPTWLLNMTYEGAEMRYASSNFSHNYEDEFHDDDISLE